MSYHKNKPNVKDKKAHIVIKYPCILRKARVVGIINAGRVRRAVVKTMMALIMEAVDVLASYIMKNKLLVVQHKSVQRYEPIIGHLSSIRLRATLSTAAGALRAACMTRGNAISRPPVRAKRRMEIR